MHPALFATVLTHGFKGGPTLFYGDLTITVGIHSGKAFAGALFCGGDSHGRALGTSAVATFTVHGAALGLSRELFAADLAITIGIKARELLVQTLGAAGLGVGAKFFSRHLTVAIGIGSTQYPRLVLDELSFGHRRGVTDRARTCFPRRNRCGNSHQSDNGKAVQQMFHLSGLHWAKWPVAPLSRD